MKKILFASFFTLLFIGGFSQSSITQTQKLATLCKVWGFLKYYHPKVAKGKFDWDNELVKKVTQIKSANTKEEINKIYIEWINSLGCVKKRNLNNNVPDSLKYNLNIAWLSDSVIFNKELISKLNFIKENRARHQYYIKLNSMPSPYFDNEKPYKDSIFPGESCRLIGLFRYWNIINYFFPYKYLIGQDWNEALIEMIPKFQFPKDTIEYHLAMLELTAKINDSHSFFDTKYTNRYFGYKWAPMKFEIIDNKAIVTGFYSDSLCKINDLQIGDAILKVNGKDISEILEKQSKYIGASNKSTKLRNSFYKVFNGSTDSVQITYERNNQLKTKYIKRDFFLKFNYKWKNPNMQVCKEYYQDIGYINMGILKRNQVDSVMRIMIDKKAIIFDIRNYPNNTLYDISEYLNNKVRPFVKFTKPDITFPGTIKWDYTYYCGKKKKLFSWMPTYKKNAKNSKDYYKGKVLLLFNEDTQSHAEFTCMALQTAPNIVSIGSQTAGADGNVSTITFPGGYNTRMTALGVYYPDGRETQRIGIVPDIVIKPTIQGIRLGKDEVLERALEYIKTGK